MNAWVTLCLLCAAPPEQIVTDFVQLQPRPDAARLSMWTRRHPRAVVLIPGFLFRPLSETPARKAVFHSWQRADSNLVKALAKDADVFALAYSQNTTLAEVAECKDLPRYMARLRMMGYREIALLGHSAGGIVAREFVEDHPDAGVTKVVQVCAPNGGSGMAQATAAVRKGQEAFLDSLTKEARQQRGRDRAHKRIPAGVEFVAVVACSGAGTDGFVGCASQWSEDLQRQGIPAQALSTTHNLAVRTRRSVEQIAHTVREHQPRWSEIEVQSARKRILGTDTEKRTTAQPRT